mmetsp:Transcript_127026/g.329553  ORF Transcript_127026/g.329553 Transcript_127026/m.329553 type:complete len:743 (+) Transcript_127026:108-2336(+)
MPRPDDGSREHFRNSSGDSAENGCEVSWSSPRKPLLRTDAPGGGKGVGVEALKTKGNGLRREAAAATAAATAVARATATPVMMPMSEHPYAKDRPASYSVLPRSASSVAVDPADSWACCLPVIDPHISPYAEKWDMVITLALLLTALWTPYEVAFIGDEDRRSRSGAVIFMVDHILDVVFIKDMMLQFMMSFPEERDGTTRWVRDRFRIIVRYMSWWFWFDMMGVVPFDLIISASSFKFGESMKDIKVVRLVRLFRLTKLGRIVKKWQDNWGVSYGQVALMKFFFITVMAVHWMSCMWGLIALQRMATEPRARTWLTGLFRNKEMTEEEMSVYSEPHRVYIISLYWSVMTLTSLGYGDIVAENLAEYCFCVFCFVTSGLIWAYVIGSMCGIISAMDPLLVQYQQDMDLLNIMMADNNLPEEMRRRLRNYFQESRNIQRKVNQQTVVNSLSPGLQGEIAMRVTHESLRHVWYLNFEDCEPISEISKRLHPMIFASQESVCLNSASRTLFVVCRGVVARSGKILGKNCVIGDDMIINSNTLRATSRAVCVTFVEVVCLRNEKLEEVRDAYPVADERIRRAAVRWAVRRAFILAAWHRMQAPPEDRLAGPRATDYFCREVPSFTTIETLRRWEAIATPRGSLKEWLMFRRSANSCISTADCSRVGSPGRPGSPLTPQLTTAPKLMQPQLPAPASSIDAAAAIVKAIDSLREEVRESRGSLDRLEARVRRMEKLVTAVGPDEGSKR